MAVLLVLVSVLTYASCAPVDLTSFEDNIFPQWLALFRTSDAPGQFSWLPKGARNASQGTSLYGTTDLVYTLHVRTLVVLRGVVALHGTTDLVYTLHVRTVLVVALHYVVEIERIFLIYVLFTFARRSVYLILLMLAHAHPGLP